MVVPTPAIVLATLVALYVPVCTPPVRLTPASPGGAVSRLWEPPGDLAGRDLFWGQWGPDTAPRPDAAFRLLNVKRTGVNPGLSVRDPGGRRWSVKQSRLDATNAEGPVEVTVSRIVEAIGYRQPPVYFLPAFSMTDDWGTRTVPGGRFRLSHKSLREVDSWSWQQNPFVGTQPYNGLLVVLLMLNSSDLKNRNNSIYEHRLGDRVERWYVVRDLGTALGATGRVAPRKNDLEAFEQSRFVLGVTDGFVEFAYQGWHQELVRRRLTPADVQWAARLLSRLSGPQWQDAFRAGGYDPVVAARFIAKIQANIAEGLRVGATGSAGTLAATAPVEVR